MNQDIQSLIASLSMSSSPPTMSPTLARHKIKLTRDVDEASIYVFKDLLAEEECLKIIKDNRDLVPSNVSPETVRSRQVFEDGELAERVWKRIERFFVDGGENGGVVDSERDEDDKVYGVVVDGDGEKWKVSSLNERWRLCCYDVGMCDYDRDAMSLMDLEVNSKGTHL